VLKRCSSLTCVAVARRERAATRLVLSCPARRASMYGTRATSHLVSLARNVATSPHRSLCASPTPPPFKNELSPRFQALYKSQKRSIAVFVGVIVIGWPIEYYLTR
jgi:hypothetical protein